MSDYTAKHWDEEPAHVTAAPIKAAPVPADKRIDRADEWKLIETAPPMNPRDISNALDLLLHMVKALSEGGKLDASDVTELKQLISRVEASR
jgi:hypothetical protein